MSTIQQRVIDIVTTHLGVKKRVELETELTDLGADSLDKVEIAMEFEEEFGIEISDEQTDQFSTLGSTITHIESLCV